MILIVDDQKENIFSLKSILEIHKFMVDTAASGEEALKKILKNAYSLIILDVQMPGMDGFEVAEAISGFSKSRDIPIIFLSAVNTDKKFITKGFASGAIDYVTKPFDYDLLLLKVKNLYRLSEQNRKLNVIQQALEAEIEFRKQAESMLQQNVQELRSILESIPQIAFTALPNGDIEFVNEHWYLYAPARNAFPQTAPGSPGIARCLIKAVESGGQLLFEVSMKRLADSAFRFHLLSMTPVKKDNEITKWVGVFTDIHEQRMINQVLEQKVAQRTTELQQSNTELEASNHELQQYASVASHDLKEPLRKIQVFGSLIRDRYLQNNPEALSYMNRVITSSDRMASLINDLLSYSRLSVESLFHPTDIRQVIDNILLDMELSIKEHNAVINIGDIPVLEVIPGQMRQVFQNIISNALKFINDDTSPVINIWAELVAAKAIDSPVSADGAYCRISVRDNGIGFNEIYLDKIFTIFQRLNSKEKYEGTGIGLAIVKKIIDKHNGLISARSAVNAGATFIIVLPVRQEPVPATLTQ